MKITPEIKQFLIGYLSACQNLIQCYDQEAMVESLLTESGWEKEYWLYTQKLSGNNSKRMNKIIRNAFKDKNYGTK